MSIKIETYSSAEPIAAQWDALADRVDAAPFVRPGWITAWHRSFGGGRLSLVCARREGEMVGAISVVHRHGVLSSPTNWHSPSFRPLAVDSQVTAELIRALLARGPRRLDFAFLDPTSEAFEDCRQAAEPLGHRTVWRVVERSPFIEITSNWAGFESSIPGHRRSKLRRFRRRLEEQGSLAIELERGDRNLEALLDEGFAVEASGWKGESGTAILSSPETARFYREVAAWTAARGWLRLWFLRLDGRALAFAFCLEHGGSHYELKVGFDSQYARFGPGVLLTRERLEHAFSVGLDSYEVLGQPERHKLDWTSNCRELARLQAFAPTPAGNLSRLAWTRGRPLALKALELRRARGDGGARSLAGALTSGSTSAALAVAFRSRSTAVLRALRPRSPGPVPRGARPRDRAWGGDLGARLSPRRRGRGVRASRGTPALLRRHRRPCAPCGRTRTAAEAEHAGAAPDSQPRLRPGLAPVGCLVPRTGPALDRGLRSRLARRHRRQAGRNLWRSRRLLPLQDRRTPGHRSRDLQLPLPPPRAPAGLGLGAVAARHAAWLSQRSGLVGKAGSGLRRQRPFDPDRAFAPGDLNAGPGRAGWLLLARLLTPELVRRRRQNYRTLLAQLSEHVSQPFDQLPAGVVPWVFPVTTPSKPALLESLAGDGIRAMDLWSVPHPSLVVKRFPDAARRRETTVALPVHQDLRERELARITASVLRHVGG